MATAGAGSNLPWKQIRKANNQEKEQCLRTEISKYKSEQLNITLIGPKHAGKSTLIDSILSIACNRIVALAHTGTASGGVGTSTFEDYPAQDGDLFEKVCFFDTMGFATTRSDTSGITDDDIKSVCEGRIQPGYEFNKSRNSGLGELDRYKPHCVIFCISAAVIDTVDEDSSYRIKIKLEDFDLLVPKDIARIAVITKIDEVCEATRRDITHIYSSKTVHRLMKRAASILGIEEIRIFPVVSYVSDVKLNAEKNVPIMCAMSAAMKLASHCHHSRT